MDGVQDFVLSSIEYPARFEDYIFESKNDAYSAHISSYRSIDSLDEILANAPPAALLSWAQNDSRFDEWQRSSGTHGRLTARRSGDRVNRSYFREIPSFISWKIGASEWLPTMSGDLRKPFDCLIAGKHIEVLFPRPADLPKEEKVKYGLSIMRDLYTAWEKVGVRPGLERLERDQVYELMLAMPERSADGKAARGLYRWFLDNSEFIYGTQGPAHAGFMENGKMWGVCGEEERYYAASDLWHKDTEMFPDDLIRQFAIVHLPSRVGAKKVEGIFGVRSLGSAGITQSISSFREAPMSAQEHGDFQEAKPFLKRLRQSQTSNAENIQKLDRLTLVVCDELVVKISVEGRETVSKMTPWEGLIESDQLLIAADPSEGGQISKDLLADAIGDTLARLFALSNGDSFSKVCRCKASDRATLLRKMCGEESVLGLESPEELDLELGRMPVFEPDLSNSIESPSSDEQEEDKEVNPDESEYPPPNAEIGGSGQGELEVHPQSHEPKERRPSRKLIVKKSRTRKKPAYTYRRLTDWEECEIMAAEFESAEGRFPLRVGNIMGEDGAGCDVFSFDSDQDRQEFEKADERDFGKISRFIEVKGRSDSGAKIDLKGNEYDCARLRGNRYFLYRFYQDEAGSFYLTSLQDPLHQAEAISHAAIVDLDRAEQSERFELRRKPVDRVIE